ncbi:MAG TPA: hypothetical protein VFY29_08285 [Terriglobia bacterium]|nr:hypothetical protein [Terriglobia bacterium]
MLGITELILLPIMTVVPFAIFLFGIYWAVRLAIRHEKQNLL